MRTVIHLIALFVGIALVTYGAYLIYPPSAYVVAGILVVIFGVANRD